MLSIADVTEAETSPGAGDAGMTGEAARRWDERAREAGASGARMLAAAHVTLHEWALLKCRYGCPDYGRRLSCPPASPSLEELRAALTGYGDALLVWVEVTGEQEEPAARRRLHEALLALERDAFLQGSRKALAFGVGPCLWCGDEPCPDDGTCRHRDKLRPSLSGCGVDVFALAETVGLELTVARDGDAAVRLVGLLLIE